VSNFRTICVAALTAPVFLIAGAAVAQNATDQSGKPLAGLRPPHEHHTLAHAKTGPAKSQHNPTARVARRTANKTAKQRSIVAASSTVGTPRRVVNPHVTWPSVEHTAAEETSMPQTALQFAPEDTASNAVATTTTVTTTTAKTKTVATDERKDSGTVDLRPTTRKLVQTQRFEAPAASQTSSQAPSETLSQMPSQMPSQAPSQASNQALGQVPSQTPVAPPLRQEMTPASRASSSTISILVTLAGAIAAGLCGWLMFGFGSARKIRVSRELAVPTRYLPFTPLR
jgi:hypothetical protein